MKRDNRIRTTSFFLSAAVLISACSSNEPKNSTTTASETTGGTTTTVVQTTVTEPVTTTEQTISSTTAAEETTTAAQKPSDETVKYETVEITDMPDDGKGYPEKLYIDYFIDERVRDTVEETKRMRDEFSQKNEFIDYKYIMDPEPSDIPEDSQKKAVEAVMKHENYISSDLTPEKISEDEKKAPYIVDGKIIPKFYKGWERDFDGDGKTERYITVQCPLSDKNYPGYICVGTFLIFEDSSGSAEVVDYIDDYWEGESSIILDYGKFIQFIFGGNGRVGALSHFTIHGIIDGKDTKIESGRQFYYKSGCFLQTSGWQGVSFFMVYDTEENKYRNINGYPADIDKLKALDADDVIPVWDGVKESDSFAYIVIGERYVINAGNYSGAEYKDGKFVGRNSYEQGPFLYPITGKAGDYQAGFDVDIDYALRTSGAEM